MFVTTDHVFPLQETRKHFEEDFGCFFVFVLFFEGGGCLVGVFFNHVFLLPSP